MAVVFQNSSADDMI